MSLHSLGKKGERFGLRPVADEDAEFLHALRIDPYLSKYVHATPLDPAAQQIWLASYYERPGDYYFCVVDDVTGEREGAISLYNVNVATGTAEMGRWILRQRSLAAAESALLVYTIAFDDLGLNRVYCRTVSANRAVVSFHRSCGLQVTDEGERITLSGVTYGVTQQSLDRSNWPEVAARLKRVSAMATGLLA
jgi:RimJ/RimL family protein N-acetyltransferase